MEQEPSLGRVTDKDSVRVHVSLDASESSRLIKSKNESTLPKMSLEQLMD